MTDAFSKNFIDYEEYPVSADIQNRCVSMTARLFNVPAHDENTNAMGTSTIGSSEAIMLATLAMKKRWANKHVRAPSVHVAEPGGLRLGGARPDDGLVHDHWTRRAGSRTACRSGRAHRLGPVSC